jgi:(p)ppGpp synthase/HD superfamily hydrolase
MKSADTPGDALTQTSRTAFSLSAAVTIRGTEGMALQMASCCCPIPGDAIVGHMRRDQGLSVHQADCASALRSRRADPERWIDLKWADDIEGAYAVNIEVSAENRRGVLGRIAIAISEVESNIVNVHLEDGSADQALIRFKVQVRNRKHLAELLRAIRRIKEVSRVIRPKSSARLTAADSENTVD